MFSYCQKEVNLPWMKWDYPSFKNPILPLLLLIIPIALDGLIKNNEKML